MPDLDEAFSKIVGIYIEAGMPQRHGLTPEQYTETCRRLWDECSTDEEFPLKILIDRYYKEILGHRFLDIAQYVDPRARASVETVKSPSDPIYCLATGHRPLAQVLRGMGTAAATASPEQAEDAEAEFDIWIVAVLDVLGFEQMYRKLGPDRMQSVYNKLMECARSSTETTTVGMSMVQYGEGSSPTIFRFTLGFSYFSDTILLWAPLAPNHVSPFLARCADLVIEAIKLGIPIRGAVAVGEALLDKTHGVFLGSSLIDAARLEHAQDWLGVTLTRSCDQILQSIDSSLVLPYTAPCKTETPVLHAGLALDWPRRARGLRVLDPAREVELLNTSPAHSKYYENTLAFIAHSLKHARWNRDTRLSIATGAICRAVSEAVLDKVPLPAEVDAMLRSLQGNGREGEITSASFRALARRDQLPNEVTTLPDGPRDMLESLQEVVRGEAMQMGEVTLAAVEARQQVRELPSRYKKALEALATERNQMWQSCIPFVRALAQGGPLPEIPSGLPPGVEGQLRMAQRAVAHEIPPIDMERLLSRVFWSNTTGEPLDGENQRRLTVLRSIGTPWSEVASYLEAIAQGRDVDGDAGRYDEGALSTIKGVQHVLAWQQAVRRSVPDACAAAFRDGIAPEDLSALLRDFAAGRLVEAAETVALLSSAGPPHDAVARFLQRLVKNEFGDLPGGVGDGVRVYLIFATTVFLHQRIELPLEYLVGVAVRTRGGSGMSTYEQAITSFLIGYGGTEGGITAHVLAMAAGKPVPEADDALDERLRLQLKRIAEMLDRRANEANLSLDELAAALLHARRGLGEIEPKYQSMLTYGKTIDERYAAVSEFLEALGQPGPVPLVPAGAPDDLKEYLAELRVLAMCGSDRIDFQELAGEVLTSRLHGQSLAEKSQELLDQMAESGEPYSRVARFLSELAVPGLVPRLPRELPMKIFTILASARREALTLDRTLIGVARRG